jgi:hypothetical protein
VGIASAAAYDLVRAALKGKPVHRLEAIEPEPDEASED